MYSLPIDFTIGEMFKFWYVRSMTPHSAWSMYPYVFSTYLFSNYDLLSLNIILAFMHITINFYLVYLIILS